MVWRAVVAPPATRLEGAAARRQAREELGWAGVEKRRQSGEGAVGRAGGDSEAGGCGGGAQSLPKRKKMREEGVGEVGGAPERKKKRGQGYGQILLERKRSGWSPKTKARGGARLQGGQAKEERKTKEE